MDIRVTKVGYLRMATIVVFWLIVALLPISLARGADAVPLRKIVIADSGLSPSHAPAWIAYETGIFRKYGLDAQIVFIESGSTTVQTLISGDVTAAQVAGTSVLESNLRGSGVVMIAGFLNTMDYKLIVAHDITRPDQLKGKALAVSKIGSSSDFATRYALEKYGLTPDKDVAILQIGSQPARFSALATGKIQGAMVAIPLTAKATRMGLNTLADLQMLGLEYQHTGVAVTQNTIKTQPELVRNVSKAFVEAIYYMKAHKKETVSILAKYLKTDDADALQEAYESICQGLMPEKPYPTLKGIQIMLREMGARDANARAARPEQFVDVSFIKELDSSGFIDRLYKSNVLASTAPRMEAPAPVVASAKEKSADSKVKAAVPVVTDTAKVAPKPAAGNTDKPVASMPKAQTASQQYTVKTGDTLSKLAERFYNSVSKWEKIYEANRDVLKNPNYIFIGMKLTIPGLDDQAG